MGAVARRALAGRYVGKAPQAQLGTSLPRLRGDLRAAPVPAATLLNGGLGEAVYATV